MWIVAFRIHTNKKKKNEINTFTSENHQRHRRIIFFDDSEMTLNFLALTCVYAFILILHVYLYVLWSQEHELFLPNRFIRFHRWCVRNFIHFVENVILLCLNKICVNVYVKPKQAAMKWQARNHLKKRHENRGVDEQYEIL